MQKTLSSLAGAAVLLAGALLVACSSAQVRGGDSTIPGIGTSYSFADVARSGAAPKVWALMRLGSASRGRMLPAGGGDLFVDDFGSNAVEILKNNRWRDGGTITDGTGAPDGNWFDANGLYVANYANTDITQYNSTSLTFTYNAGMVDPVGVTTDSAGNVYEADYAYPEDNGFVNEYAQGANKVIAHCAPGGAVESVAVDQRGDVFVGYNSGSLGYITEYLRGLRNCRGIQLSLPLGFIGGMVIDKEKNLVVCDQLSASVDIIAPPYRSIAHTVGSGYYDPFHVTINRSNNRAYVTDLGAHNVQVVSYPIGSPIATLGASNGLNLPSSAVDTNNYVP